MNDDAPGYIHGYHARETDRLDAQAFVHRGDTCPGL
jgi:hypothetical protein